MERMSKLAPIHPMTLSLLSTVAQNFGASQRTLFRFMKDRKESDEGVGFIHYIQAHGPTNWPWLTADYLWDYFFLRSSDIRGVLKRKHGKLSNTTTIKMVSFQMNRQCMSLRRLYFLLPWPVRLR